MAETVTLNEPITTAKTTSHGSASVEDAWKARSNAPKPEPVIPTAASPEKETPSAPTPTPAEPVSVTEPAAEPKEEPTQTTSEPIEVTEEQVIKVNGREVPVKELLGQKELVSRKQRKIAKLEPLAEQGKVLQQSPRLSAIAQLVERGMTEDQAIQAVVGQPQPEPKSSDPEPQPPQGFAAGDPEMIEYTVEHALWKQRQEFKPALNFIQQIGESQKEQQERVKAEQQTLDANNRFLSEYTEYAPFDYASLTPEKQQEFNARVVKAASDRGLVIAGANSNLSKVQLNAAFVENIVRDAADGWTPESKTIPAIEKPAPMVPKPQPKQPVVPLPAGVPQATAPKPKQRYGSQTLEDAWKSRSAGEQQRAVINITTR